jgi:biotin carboxyl carrier protein
VQFEIDVGGRVRHVVVTRAGDGFTVTLDGRSRRVNAARIDAHTLSLLIGPVSHEVTIAPDRASGQLTVRVGTAAIVVAVNGRRRSERKEDGGYASSGPQRVVAPMPGKIVRVLVKPGNPVRARQALVVIEAMKMEIELRAARDGTVAEVQATEGVSVDAGAVLVVISRSSLPGCAPPFTSSIGTGRSAT